MNFDYYIPTRILFGAGRLNDLHKQKLPGKKALGRHFQRQIDPCQRLSGAGGKGTGTGRRGACRV